MKWAFLASMQITGVPGLFHSISNLLDYLGRVIVRVNFNQNAAGFGAKARFSSIPFLKLCEAFLSSKKVHGLGVLKPLVLNRDAVFGQVDVEVHVVERRAQFVGYHYRFGDRRSLLNGAYQRVNLNLLEFCVQSRCVLHSVFGELSFVVHQTRWHRRQHLSIVHQHYDSFDERLEKL